MSSSTAIVGTLPPPPGVTANFDNPESIAGRLILAAAIWPAVTIPIVLLRLYTSSFIVRRWHRDDTFIIIALVFATGNSIISGVQTGNGAGLHIWDVPITHFMRFMQLGSIGGSLTYNLATMFIKLSFLSLYLRYSTGWAFHAAVYFLMLITTAYSLAMAFSWAWLCRPMASLWDWSTVGGSCVNPNTPFIAATGTNVGTDILIFLLPVWMLWPVKMRLMTKISVAVAMTVGGFVCVVSILRLSVLLSGVGSDDSTWYYLTNLVWLLCEMYTGIICACLLRLRSFVKYFFPNLAIFREDVEVQPLDGNVKPGKGEKGSDTEV
ncbi:hypothetical protein B0T19DRAFT_485546 [Cercophora scortea]|uniref:Rhodopsin domain-containing protein n=1 Tax=Cercophora scortea TaxID=314031 RepID=A0AAE0IE35_9PEZI|nr:hypothetical protein B0T19DRAFT_485546 [Cercophora scortea]